LWQALRLTPDAGDETVKLGELTMHIVGGQFYDGEVQNVEAGDQVALVREPFNAYDPYAVRVNNANGVQLGHIKAKPVSQAGALVHLLDNPDPRAPRVEATMLCTPSSVYNVPIKVIVTGLAAHAAAVSGHFYDRGMPLTDAWLDRRAA
jgi:SWI/SNF-related matrix-associated actin-dependent regulator of chromatin subfamily A3